MVSSMRRTCNAVSRVSQKFMHEDRARMRGGLPIKPRIQGVGKPGKYKVYPPMRLFELVLSRHCLFLFHRGKNPPVSLLRVPGLCKVREPGDHLNQKRDSFLPIMKPPFVCVCCSVACIFGGSAAENRIFLCATVEGAARTKVPNAPKDGQAPIPEDCPGMPPMGELQRCGGRAPMGKTPV